jgi:maleylpyruvate isomerase
MIADLESTPDRAVDLCLAAHARLVGSTAGLTDAQMRQPSRLPGWAVGHVLTHLARNADGHARRLGGALRGEDLARYPGGGAQRDAEIEQGVRRPAAEILADLAASQKDLEAVFAASSEAGWPNSHLLGADAYPTTGCPSRRLREVEMHHVDLGLGYEPSDWPEEYVAWDLPILLAGVPDRLRSPDDRRVLMAWVAGRRPSLGDVDLEPW